MRHRRRTGKAAGEENMKGSGGKLYSIQWEVFTPSLIFTISNGEALCQNEKNLFM